MYTIMDKEIVEKKLNDTNILKLKQELLCNQSENYYFANTNENRKDNQFFILSNNIQYLKGLSYEEVMLYIILERLKDYIQLPNIVFYECLMNIMGQIIIISDKNLPPGYQEIGFALYSNKYFSFDQKESPFYVQSEYYYNENEFVNNDDGYVFKIYQNRLYFFEFKYSLNYFKIGQDILKNKEKYKNKTKDPHTFLIKLINKCMLFKDLYVNKFSIPNDTQIEIIIFYDDNMSKIFDLCLDTIKSILRNKNIRLSLIYVLSNYPFYSLRSEIEKNRKERVALQNKYDTLEANNKTMQSSIDTLKNENEQLKQNFRELQEKFNKLAKVKMGDAEGGAEENAKK